MTTTDISSSLCVISVINLVCILHPCPNIRGQKKHLTLITSNIFVVLWPYTARAMQKELEIKRILVWMTWNNIVDLFQQRHCQNSRRRPCLRVFGCNFLTQWVVQINESCHICPFKMEALIITLKLHKMSFYIASCYFRSINSLIFDTFSIILGYIEKLWERLRDRHFLVTSGGKIKSTLRLPDTCFASSLTNCGHKWRKKKWSRAL